MKNTAMNKVSTLNSRGFTLIEILSVLVIISAVLAVIIPRAYRASVDTKYVLVRQVCAELASNANMWGERMHTSQPLSSTAKKIDYMDTLTGGAAGAVEWIATNDANNWNTRHDPVSPANGVVSSKVEDLMAQAKKPRNPFGGTNVFVRSNDPTYAGGPVPGAIACVWQTDTTISATVNHCYALIYQGVDNTGTNDFHAGQDSSSMQGLRNGVFITLLEP